MRSLHIVEGGEDIGQGARFGPALASLVLATTGWPLFMAVLDLFTTSSPNVFRPLVRL